MAKRKYSQNSSYRGRQIFLITAFVLVVAMAVWRGFSVKSTSCPSDAQIEAVQTKVKPEVKGEAGVSRAAKSAGDNLNPSGHSELKRAAAEPGRVPDVQDVKEQSREISRDTSEDIIAVSFKKSERIYLEGLSAMTAGEFLAAGFKLTQAVELGLPSGQDSRARESLAKAADEWLFSPKIFSDNPFCERYMVVAGDRLVRIGKNYNIPYQLLMRINGIKKPADLRAGRTIKVVKGPFHAVVDRSRHLIYVYLDELMVRSYPISIGTQGRETPTGRWVVKIKQVNPEWTDPETGKKYLPESPDNPLGRRWIALDGLEGDAIGRTGFGIHGTIEPEEIGRAASRGCVRLLNKDVTELYDMLIEDKSQVRVVN